MDLYEKEEGLYNFINIEKKKISLRLTKSDLLYPIENYYQAQIKSKIRIINLAKYEFDPSMLKMSTGINNIGIAFWNYNSGNHKKFENLIINLNNKTKYFIGNKIITKKPNIFVNPETKAIHYLLFLLRKYKNIRTKIM